MKVYDADHIRNIALIGHQSAGKTMLAEAMLHSSGSLDRMGSIEEGSTVSDYHSSEIDRGMSIFTSLLHAEWEGHKINVLDTPGYPDFVAEVMSALKVADTAVFVLNATEGVQVGTEQAWKYAKQMEKPAMFVVNQLDRGETSFEALIAPIQERFGRPATVVQLPGGGGSRSIIDVMVMKQLTFPEGTTEVNVSEIPEAFADEAERLHSELVEDIAENDEELMELYFEQGTLTETQMREGLRQAMVNRQLFPIFLTSATENIGVGRLMSFIDYVCPSPAQMPGVEILENGRLPADPSADPVMLIYRTMAEEHIGEFSFFRVCSGTISQGIDLQNAQTSNSERVGQLYATNGQERDIVQEMVAGDIGAVMKLKNTHTNDTLRGSDSDITVTPIEFPEPRFFSGVRPAQEGDEDKLATGLHQLVEEDPSIEVRHDTELKQIVLGGQGEMHLRIAKYRLENRFGVEVEFFRPRVAYRERPTGRGDSSYRHKKQTGGAGQFADITLYVEPFEGPYEAPDEITVRGERTVETDWGATIQFIDAIVGGVIDMRRFFGAIQKGILEIAEEGPIAGYPVGDVRVVIYDGGMHPVDSNEAAFRMAAKMCFRQAFLNADPVLLEPIQEVEVTIPGDYMGEVMGDLSSRRGQIQGIEADGLFQKISAYVPDAEMYKYSTTLRSIAHGRGLHTASFSHYAVLPPQEQENVIEDATKAAEEV
jgi:elongation factor G